MGRGITISSPVESFVQLLPGIFGGSSQLQIASHTMPSSSSTIHRMGWKRNSSAGVGVKSAMTMFVAQTLCHRSSRFGRVSSWRAISSRLGFSSWLYQLDEWLRFGVDDRLLVEERLIGRIVEVEEERLRDGEVVVVVVAVCDILGSGVVKTNLSPTGFPDERRQSVFIPPEYLNSALGCSGAGDLDPFGLHCGYRVDLSKLISDKAVTINIYSQC